MKKRHKHEWGEWCKRVAFSGKDNAVIRFCVNGSSFSSCGARQTGRVTGLKILRRTK